MTDYLQSQLAQQSCGQAFPVQQLQPPEVQHAGQQAEAFCWLAAGTWLKAATDRESARDRIASVRFMGFSLCDMVLAALWAFEPMRAVRLIPEHGYKERSRCGRHGRAGICVGRGLWPEWGLEPRPRE